ncbi:hypothetical protein NDU88_000732 [Pleurodeles waltl]|uniref:Uncharacterized protein n=1 Tax=Pleurodeles waltl TaxID=8319 RepID=A0AAV7S7U1_PLEWA|nr:hypothetical protein NDU88_000732 [Pleurodeles waltl]
MEAWGAPDAAGGPIKWTDVSADWRGVAWLCLLRWPLTRRAAEGEKEPAARVHTWATSGRLTAGVEYRSVLQLPECGCCGGGGAALPCLLPEW